MTDEAVVREDDRGGAHGLVLVVEDDLLLRRVLVQILQTWGYAVVEAADGVVAVDRLREAGRSLTVVLLDVMLPRLGGIEVARAAGTARPDLPIVACSAALTEGTIAELRQVGVVHFLPKPYTPAGLRAALEVAIRTPTARTRESAASPAGTTGLPLRLPPASR